MDHCSAFIKCFEAFGPKHNRYQVMSDLALFGSAALHNAVALSQDLEDEYLRAAKRYDREELSRHAELLATVVAGLEAGGEDFLGQAFMTLELGNDRAGQFFTPWHVSKMMAQISHGEALSNLGGEFVTFSEPACATGSENPGALPGLLGCQASAAVYERFNRNTTSDRAGRHGCHATNTGKRCHRRARSRPTI